jgi:hypothetical protein
MQRRHAMGANAELPVPELRYARRSRQSRLQL